MLLVEMRNQRIHFIIWENGRDWEGALHRESLYMPGGLFQKTTLGARTHLLCRLVGRKWDILGELRRIQRLR